MSTQGSGQTPDLLVTDLDGTLVHGRGVDPVDVRALMRWREAGNLLAIATGRSVMLARLAVSDASRAAGEDFEADYIICASGTTLLDGQGHVLRTEPIDPEQVREATEFLMARGDCAIVATTLDGDYLLANPLPPEDNFHTYATRYVPATLEEVLTKDVTSMPVCIPDKDLADRLSQELVERSGGAIGAPRSTDYLDIVPAGQDKGTAVEHLRQFLAAQGTRVSRVVTAGDSWNDIPMFAVADLACAMETGAADAREAALRCGGVVLPSLAALVDHILT